MEIQHLDTFSGPTSTKDRRTITKKKPKVTKRWCTRPKFSNHSMDSIIQTPPLLLIIKLSIWKASHISPKMMTLNTGQRLNKNGTIIILIRKVSMEHSQNFQSILNKAKNKRHNQSMRRFGGTIYVT